MLGFYMLGVFIALGLSIILVAKKLYLNAALTLIFLSGSFLCQFFGV
jgi:hypothetical protein